MIEIWLLIPIGGLFYKLAMIYEKKNLWLYPVLAILTYFGGSFIGAVILGFILAMTGTSIDISNQILMTIISITLGSLFCTALYFILKFNWKKQTKTSSNSNFLDDDLNVL